MGSGGFEGDAHMAERDCNGWSNYETWNLALWIGNDEGSDRYWREVAQDVYDEAEADRNFTRSERAALDLAERLKDEITESNPLADGASFFADVLNAAIAEVNWYEIAEHWLDDVDTDEADQPATVDAD
jgi:hypothetical protein